MLKRSAERCVNISERSGAGAEPERNRVERRVNIRERSGAGAEPERRGGERSGAGAERRGGERSGAERSGATCEYEYRRLSGKSGAERSGEERSGGEPERKETKNCSKSDQLYHVFKTTSLQDSLAVRLKATNSRSDAAKRVGSNPRVLESQPKAIIYLF